MAAGRPDILTQPQGFAGADGAFALRPDGRVRRGLAVFQVGPEGARIVDPGAHQPVRRHLSRAASARASIVRPRLVLATAAAIASTPLLVLAALVAGHAAAAGPALLAGLLVVVTAMLLAMLWARDQATMIEEVRRAADGLQASDIPIGLRPNTALMAEIERLIRVLSDRNAAASRQLHVEEAIAEALPDPLILLTADRSVLRANAAARAAFGADMQAVLRHPGLRSAIDRTLAQGVAAERRPDPAGSGAAGSACGRLYRRRAPPPAAAGVAPMWPPCCRTARGSGRWNACARISSPMPATSCARHWPA